VSPPPDPGTTPLAGQVALVTGASRGIGLAVADALQAAGAHVIRLARSLENRSGERRTDIRCDVSAPAEVDRATRQILKASGVPHIVVNNAGVFFVKSLEETAPAEFLRTIAVNLTGPWLFVRALLPDMVRRGSGHLVTLGSISDHVAFPGSTAYAASKFGLRGMHEVLRAETAKSGVRTTLVSPGPVDTDIWDAVDPDSKRGFTKRKDMLSAGDVADAVLWAVTRPVRVDVTEIRLLPAIYSPRG
jgi:NADP-dependent 3-hydroxy acid dehydrogenase YdfG